MRIFFFFAIMAACVFGTFSAQASPIVSDEENCMMCHKYPGLSRVNDEGYLRQFYVDPTRFEHSVHTNVKCTGCHVDIKEIPHKEAARVDCSTACHGITMGDSAKPFSHAKVADEMKGSIHNVDNSFVNARIAESFPTCTDCHSNPSFRFMGDDVSDVHNARTQDRIYQKCGVCHENTDYKYYFNHVTHRIKDLAPDEDIVATCSKCHSRPEMVEKHKLKNAASTYLDTFHGKAVSFGLENAPTCIDCHVKTGESAHKILSHKDKDSATFVENRYLSCEGAGCHNNVNKEFGMIRMHVVIDKDIYPIEFWTAVAFTILTLSVFFLLQGLMILELIRTMFPNLSLRRKKKS